MNVLVACEESQVVCRAFREYGHEAYSNDLLECSGGYPEWHLHMDARDAIELMDWDIMIAHPPCTHLAVSGARWFKHKQREQDEAIEFVALLLDADISKICLENPVSVISTRIRKPDQIIQPWMFGHGETKTTCLWLKNLSPLTPTKIVNGREHRIHRMPPSKDRSKMRSRTYEGIARAMAAQWGCLQ